MVAWAGCPPCHQWGLAAHERVTGASSGAQLPCSTRTPPAQCRIIRPTHLHPPISPKRRPIQQKQAIFSDCHPIALHYGGHIPSSRGLAPSIGGIALHGGPTRRRHAARRLRVVQNPPPTPMWGCRGTAKYGGGAARRWRGRGSVRPGTVPGTVEGQQTRQNSPGTAPPPLNPRQNSPSNLKNVKFGVFRARRANFFAHRTR